jgi:rhamnosyltransferase
MGADLRRPDDVPPGASRRGEVSPPLVSIVLLTQNGAGTLPAALDAIARQRADFAFEVVAVDSGSDDGTLALLESAAHQVVSIRPDSFNHGLTRNLGVERARGELIVFLVQDAVPASDDWLVRLTAPLRVNPAVAGAFCRQQPRPDATVITRRYLHMWVAASTSSRSIRLAAPGDLHRLEPMAQLRLCAFDNVCSCIRRFAWEQIPFPETPIAEDLEWGKAALLAGHQLNFVADAVVVHSHERSARYEFVRTYLLHRRLFQLFGLRTIPTAAVLARAVATGARTHISWERQEPVRGPLTRRAMHALALAVAWPLGQYLGGLSASRGWEPVRFARI